MYYSTFILLILFSLQKLFLGGKKCPSKKFFSLLLWDCKDLNCQTHWTVTRQRTFQFLLTKKKMTWFCLPFKFYFTSCEVSLKPLNAYLFWYLSPQDRSPKTQSQVRRMIEAGQMDQRVRQPPTPPSSPQSPQTNAPAHNPAVEKSESVCNSRRANEPTCAADGRVTLPSSPSPRPPPSSPLQWRTFGRLPWQ